MQVWVSARTGGLAGCSSPSYGHVCQLPVTACAPAFAAPGAGYSCGCSGVQDLWQRNNLSAFSLGDSAFLERDRALLLLCVPLCWNKSQQPLPKRSPRNHFLKPHIELKSQVRILTWFPSEVKNVQCQRGAGWTQRKVFTFRTGLIIQKASSSLQIQVSKSCHFLMYMYNLLSAIHLLNTWF